METRAAIEAFAFGDALAKILNVPATVVDLVHGVIPALEVLFRGWDVPRICMEIRDICGIRRFRPVRDCTLDQRRDNLLKILCDVEQQACIILLRKEYYHTLLPHPSLGDDAAVVQYPIKVWTTMAVTYQVHSMLEASPAAEEGTVASSAAEDPAPRGGGEAEGTVVSSAAEEAIVEDPAPPGGGEVEATVPPPKARYVPPHKRA